MNYSLLKDLVQQLENFEKEGGKAPSTLEEFRIWLNEKSYKKESPEKLAKDEGINFSDLENDICKQVIMLGRYSKLLLRKGTYEHQELANEDFTYLFRLMDYKELSKIQLIEKNGHEKQTGLEIIKRLAKNELISEYPNPADRRSKHVAITEKGRETFHSVVMDINKVSCLLTGNLNRSEKTALYNLLKKLNNFHEVIYTNHREDSIEHLQKTLIHE